MKIIKSVKEMEELRILMTGQKIGFVPTMGFFHEGHLALMDQAREESDILLVSVFVNPLQFGPNEDFHTYPRDEEGDTQLAKKHDVDILFMPSVEEIYPRELSITMQVGDRANVLCGRSRPGHFDGVVTILSKLFNIVQPDHVFLGMKDAQQVAVVEGLIADYNYSIKLIGLPTIRDVSGLAKSSRNVFLSKIERKEAAWIQKALKTAEKLIDAGERNAREIIKSIENTIKNNTSGQIDYVELLSYPTLRPVTKIDHRIIIAVAVNFQKVRLIDNLIID